MWEYAAGGTYPVSTTRNDPYWQNQLECYIAHLGVVGGDKNVIEKVELLRKGMLKPVQFVEKALDAVAYGA